MSGLIGNILGGVFFMPSAKWPNWLVKPTPTATLLVPSASLRRGLPLALVPLKPSFISPMFIQTAFSFSNAVQRWVCRFSGLRLVALRWFVVFLASGPCVASASSYFFRSAVPPRWHRAFSQLAPVAKLRLSVLASGSNISVKPTRILRSA
ncbi:MULTISPECIES: DUF1010 domain-containing protein [Enterobacteriaceae]|uniref:DUF1010 domain-containing protein n=1 Tax=Enterobacteriaceae TaxID=543 RepID=UPI002869B704|nr:MULTISPECIES: DUF1010 domain-containing protein [Enterobacteriaceae]MDY7933666.1 DUF1010 domain-containing protein [Escherichia coli]